jgi:hypothetical protein
MLEAQQALLMQALRRAGGEPVSYAALRDAGVELPASVVAELELAGVAIERCRGGVGSGPRVLGVRLRESPVAPAAEPEPEPANEAAAKPRPQPIATGADDDGWTPVRVYRTAPGRALADNAVSSLAAAGALAARGTRTLRARDGRLIAAVGLGAAIVVAAVLALTALNGSARHTSAPEAVAHRPSRAHVAQTASPSPKSTPTTSTTTATPVSPALATQLESQGHQLLADGQYAGAVPVLRRALAATGEQANACLEPNSTTCLTYAYALYDLGRALRLSGHSAAAVPILEARLQIDNQRPAVAAELQLARQHIS